MERGDLRSPAGTPGKSRPPLGDGPFLVLGLARSGRAAALALRARGLEVIGTDSGTPDAGALKAAGVEVHLGTTGTELLPRARAVVKSPGVPAEAPAVAGARERGLEVIGELELAWRLLANEFIAITGTNGKTTTTELVGHIHRVAGLPVAVAGNVGSAVASLVGAPGAAAPLHPEAVVVCECSSFQLEDTIAFSPEAAVLLNVSEDHLDRHGTLDAYTAAKLQAFARQGNDDVAVFPCDLGIEDLGGCARRVCFGDGPDAELADRAGQLWWDEQPLIAVEEVSLRGAHNRLNAMAAAAVTLARGVDPDAVREGLRTFTGVPHRLEEVGRQRRPLRQRLQGHEHRQHRGRAGQLPARHRPPDPRRPGQGPGLHRPARADRALRAPRPADRRGRPADRRRAQAHRAAGHAVRRPRARPGRRLPRRSPGRRRAALTGLRELRPVRGLRGPRGSVSRAGR